MSTNLKTTPIMDRVNAIVTGAPAGQFGGLDYLVGAYKSDLSLSDLGILETVRAYLSNIPATAALYGDHLGWITVGEYLDRVTRSVESIANCYDGLSEWAENVYQEYGTAKQIDVGTLAEIADSYDLTQADIIGLLKHGRYIALGKGA